MLGQDPGPVTMLGCEQIVQIHRVFRMRVAANVAFAAIHAGGLQRPVTVSLLDPDGGGIVEIVAEEDVDVAELRIPPFLLGDFLEQLRAHDLSAQIAVFRRNRASPEHRLRYPVVGLEAGSIDRFGPPLGEHLVRRLHVDVRVDQRPAAVTGADDRVHIAKIADVEHPVQIVLLRDVFRTRPVFVGKVPEIARHVVRRARERTHGIALSAL